MGKREITFGKLMRKRREEFGYSRKDMANLLGYKKTVKGIRRIERLEDGWIVEVVLARVMDLLGVGEGERLECRKEDEGIEYGWKLANPVKPHMVIRWIAAVYMRKDVPEGGAEEEMLEYVREVAVEYDRICWLVVSHWVRYKVEGDGSWRLESGVGEGPKGKPDVGVVLKGGWK